MRRLGLHLFLRTSVVFSAVLATLTLIVWVTQALRRFDLVTAKGQAIATYLGMTLLAVPFLVSVVAPFSLVIAMVVVLNSMHAGSELVAINAAGASQRQVAAPFIVLSLIVAVLVAWIGLFAGPQSLQALRDQTNRIRADVVANVVQPGRFVEIDENFTFHIRNRAGDGSLEDLFIYDARDPEFVFTYTAERGRVVNAVEKTLVVMETGTIERTRRDDGSSTYVAFGSYAFDLTELKAAGDKERPYQPNERTITELYGTPLDDPYRKEREDRFRAEIHTRLTAPLYPVAMALTTFLFLGFPTTTRSGRTAALAGGIVVSALIRVVGFALAGLAAADEMWLPVVWGVPILFILASAVSLWLGVQPFVPRFLAEPLERLSDFIRRSADRMINASGPS
nr:LptF/LptG family permease [Chthonobacter albigriseus]